MEAQHFQEGDLQDYTPAAAVTGGQVINLAGEGVYAPVDIAANVKGAVRRRGIAKIAGTSAVGNVGDPVWWDDDGDPVGGTAGSGAATTLASAGDYPIGSLAAAKAAADTHAYVRMNQYDVDPRVWFGKTHETKSANYTMDAQDVGKVIHIDTDAFTITLPATVVGYDYIFVNDAADGGALITISPNANDKIMGPDVAGVDNKDRLNTKATAIRGDWLQILGDGADGWFVKNERGIWAAEA